MLSNEQQTISIPRRLFTAALILATSASWAFAQDDAAPLPSERTDAYGNAIPPPANYRPVGLILSDSTRVDRLGGIDILSRWRAATAPDNLLGTRQTPPPGGSLSAGLTGLTRTEQLMQRLFAQFGGFETRSSLTSAEPSSAIARRQGLIAATKLNTPVQRVMLRNSGTLSTVSQVTVPEPPLDAVHVPVPPLNLDDVLRDRTTVLHIRSTRDGWALFAKGQYRAAARAFSAAADLDPADFESRTGDLLCQLSLGAMNTAVAVLDAIVTRFENPFLVDLQLSGRYGSPAEAQDIRTRAKVFAQREGAEAPIIAVHAFALWVLGEPEEAIRAAGAIRARFPDSSYAKWPDQMRSARAARTIEPQP